MPLTTPPAWLLTAFRLPVRLYDHRMGQLLGQRFLPWTHTGRRTGRRHATVLEVVCHNAAAGEYVVVSGRGDRADWLRNLEAGGPDGVTVGRTTCPVTHRVLDIDEAMDVLVDYERRNRLIAPLLRRALSALVGKPLRGTNADRRMLVSELPFIRLRAGQLQAKR